MKILFVCSTNNWGSDENWINLAMRVLSREHQIYLCYRNKILRTRFNKDIPKFRAPLLNIFDLFTYLKIIRFINRENIQILVPTKKKEFFICGIISILKGTVNILRLGMISNIQRGFWNWLILNKLSRGIIVSSKRIKQHLVTQSLIAENKVKVIYECLDINKLQVTKQWIEGDFNIVSVGNLVPSKGFHILLKAVANLSKEIKQNLKVNIVGTGDMEIKLRLMVKELGLSDIVFFRGFMQDPNSVVLESDLFVMLSTDEVLSTSMLEAMALGVPVLASYASGAAEIITDNENGYLVDANYLPDVITCLENIIQNRKTLPSMGLNGRDVALKTFCEDNMKTELEEFFFTQLRNKRKKSRF